jgi:2-polyprenyl-3-methyl-5-hydroxy-6-metoxy-1,4-benzoquinol methylase
MTAVSCPIWPDDQVELIEEISRDDVIWIYLHTFGVDISPEITEPAIRLYRNPAKDYYFFSPMRAGTENFYKKLYSKMGYSTQKPEFNWVAQRIPRKSKLLDVGCGTGNFSKSVQEADYLGIDFNEESIATAKASGVNAKIGSVEDLIIMDEVFDVVTLFQVLEHVERPLELLQKCASLTRANGLLAISVPNVNSYISIRENTPLNMPPHHLSWYSLKSLIIMGNELGLKLNDCFEQPLVSQASYVQSYLKESMNRLIGRSPSRIRRSIVDRAVSAAAYQAGRLLPTPPLRIGPKAPSMTVLFKKA